MLSHNEKFAIFTEIKNRLSKIRTPKISRLMVVTVCKTLFAFCFPDLVMYTSVQIIVQAPKNERRPIINPSICEV